MWFQNGTTFEKENIKYRSEKYLPYVYTEQCFAISKIEDIEYIKKISNLN